MLCQLNSSVACDATEGSVAPQIILFAAQLISGFGGSLYHSLGLSYMDDNVKRSKTPALISMYLSFTINNVRSIVNHITKKKLILHAIQNNYK